MQNLAPHLSSVKLTDTWQVKIVYRSCMCYSTIINPQRQGKRAEEQLHCCSPHFLLSLWRLAGRLSSAVCVRGRGVATVCPAWACPPSPLGPALPLCSAGAPSHTQTEANLPSLTPLAKWFLWICGSQSLHHNELKSTPVRHLLPQETILAFCPHSVLLFFSLGWTFVY